MRAVMVFVAGIHHLQEGLLPAYQEETKRALSGVALVDR